MNNIVAFLTELTQNNNREWFYTHKKEYQKARKSFNDYFNEALSFESEEPKVDF